MIKNAIREQLERCIEKALIDGVGAILPSGDYHFDVCNDLDIRFSSPDCLMQIYVSKNEPYIDVIIKAIPNGDESLLDQILYIIDAGALLNRRLDPAYLTLLQNETDTQEIPRAVLPTDETQEFPRLTE